MLENRKVKLIKLLNPFNRKEKEITYLDYEPLKPISYYLEKANIKVDYVVSLNGNVLDENTIVPENAEIVICPVVAGKKVFGNIFRAVLTVAVMAVAINAPTWLGVTGKWASAFLRAGVLLGGMMVVNAIFPAQPPKLSWESEATKSSPTYGWDGIQTTAREGIVIPVLYGKMKLGGNVISKYVEVSGNKQYLNMAIGLCHGKVDSISDIKINNNPIDNYHDVQYDLRYGTNDQDVVSYMNVIETDNPQQVRLTTDYYPVRTQGDAVDGIRVDFNFPYGLFHMSKRGKYESRSVTLEVGYKLVSESEYTEDKTITKTVTDYKPDVKRISIKITGLTPGKYDVRVRRTSAEGSITNRDYDVVYLSNVAEIVSKDLAYPNLAYLAIRALATDQLSGVMPNVTCIVDRGLFSSNDMGVSSVLVGKASNNPAWVVYDILTNKLYGGGMFGLTDNYIDYDSFAEWADFCDSENLKCNVVFDTQTTLWDACVRVANENRGILKIEGSKISVTIDKPTTVSQLFSMGNIIKDSFKEAFLPQRERINCIEVTFMNEEHDYERESFVVYTDDWAYGQEIRSSMSLYTVTDYEQAVKHAQYMLNYNKYITRTIEFEADIDSIACTVGDVIRFQHDLPTWGYGGRILEAGGNYVKLDREVDLVESQKYKLVYRKDNDTVYEKTFTATQTTSTDTLNLSFADEEIPEKYNIYAFGEINLAYKEFRITSITRTDDLRCRITAIEYNPTIYTDQPSIAPLPSPESLYTIHNLQGVEEYVLFDDGTIGSRIHATWIYHGGAVRRWHIYIKDVSVDPDTGNYLSDDQTWKYVTSVETSEAYIRYGFLEGNTYRIAVVYEDFFGRAQSPDNAPYVDVTIYGKQLPPNDVENFTYTIDKQNGILLTWNENEDVDLAGYNLYLDDQKILDIYKGNKYLYGFALVPYGETSATHTFAIEAVDTSGNVSENNQTISVTVTTPTISSLKAQSIDNNVLLFWQINEGTFNFSHCIVKRGNSFDSGELIGTKKGSFTSFFEFASGDYTYWVAPVDVVGNIGPAVSVTVKVNNPPDYVLNADWFSNFDGPNTIRVNTLYSETEKVLMGCVNTAETYEEHFTNNSWNSPQDQIDAGYALWLSPFMTSGSYEEVFDYGAELSGSKIRVNMTVKDKSADFSATCTISIAPENNPDNWTDYSDKWEIYASNFRYVKVHIDYTTSSDKDWFEIASIEVVLDSKIRNDMGRVYVDASDPDGTTVYFNVDFVDVTSITVTAEGNSSLIATYQFDDVPNPTSFKVFLFDKDGNRASGYVSWQARGY